MKQTPQMTVVVCLPMCLSETGLLDQKVSWEISFAHLLEREAVFSMLPTETCEHAPCLGLKRMAGNLLSQNVHLSRQTQSRPFLTTSQGEYAPNKHEFAFIPSGLLRNCKIQNPIAGTVPEPWCAFLIQTHAFPLSLMSGGYFHHY